MSGQSAVAVAVADDLEMSLEKAHARKMAARFVRPRTPEELRDYIEYYYGIHVPDVRVCGNHQTPFEYVVGSFFSTTEGWSEEEKRRYRPHRNCVVKASRGGMKTTGGALTTHLDSVHYPPCATSIIGGSGLQSTRMHECTTEFDYLSFIDLVRGEKPGTIRKRYKNGSKTEIHTQSRKSVRGPHKPRVKLDEVDEFEEQIYKDSLGIPQSDEHLESKLERFSTVHRPGGLMSRVLDAAREAGEKIYEWCVFEVVQRCQRPCSESSPNPGCLKLIRKDSLGREHSFWSVCHGKAKRGDGYYTIDDLHDKFTTMDWETFCSDMLGTMPKREGLIYPTYDETFHLLGFEPEDDKNAIMIMGFDGGYDHPHALWINVLLDKLDTMVVIDEYAPSNITAPRFIEGVLKIQEERKYQPVTVGFADPSAKDLRQQLNQPEIAKRLFREGGDPRVMPFRCLGVRREVKEGYGAVRCRLDRFMDGDGDEWCGLYISRRCAVLNAQMAALRSKMVQGQYIDEQVKENDHGPDALRYPVMGWKIVGQQYRSGAVTQGLFKLIGG